MKMMLTQSIWLVKCVLIHFHNFIIQPNGSIEQMYKACSRCGKIHDNKYKCSYNKPKYDYSRYGSAEERRLRNTQAWAKKSIEIREQAQYLCEVCRDKGIYNYNGLEVHHRTKLRDNKQGLLEDTNLICLCVKHHKQADRGQLSKDYLQKLALQRLTRR